MQCLCFTPFQHDCGRCAACAILIIQYLWHLTALSPPSMARISIFGEITPWGISWPGHIYVNKVIVQCDEKLRLNTIRGQNIDVWQSNRLDTPKYGTPRSWPPPGKNPNISMWLWSRCTACIHRIVKIPGILQNLKFYKNWNAWHIMRCLAILVPNMKRISPVGHERTHLI